VKGAVHEPRFGQADLTNCERELIHLAGSIQPHGVLLVLREPDLRIVQTSANCADVLGRTAPDLLGLPAEALAAEFADLLREQAHADLSEPLPFGCRFEWADRVVHCDAAMHRVDGAGLVVELEPADRDGAAPALEDLKTLVAAAIERIGSANGIGALSDAVVREVRDLTGYDRVMVYRFDPDGHGKIIAEARDPRLEPLLGHHYPASDIPQRARELYLRNRVRVLVDVHCAPAPLVPAVLPPAGTELDMSLCALRSMSPLHIQYLKNMGVTATLVASLVREGRLWGLIACHHYAPRRLPPALRTACGLLAEVVSTRIAAIENYAHAQVAIMVRRIEQRLIEATSSEGDWRLALLRSPRMLLQPLEASGAALFDQDEILTAGEVPSTPQLRALRDWIHAAGAEDIFACASIGRANPELASLTPTASGVLAVRLSAARADYLMWFRREQLQSVTWAGDPTKPVAVGNDPRDLSPRRSFAAWSEIVRGTAAPWTAAEVALARAIGTALIDIIVQVHAVRLLIAEHQLATIRATLDSAAEPVLIADALGRVLLLNDALARLLGTAPAGIGSLQELAARFASAVPAQERLRRVVTHGEAWRGETVVLDGAGVAVPVSVRAESIPGRDGRPIGTVLVFADLREAKRTDAARQHLQEALSQAALRFGLSVAAVRSLEDAPTPQGSDEVVRAILANASLAAMDIAEASGGPAVAPLLQEVEASALRAAALYAQIRAYEENRKRR
jgi:chemotaxis family two-component system sensor kinase Cph1